MQYIIEKDHIQFQVMNFLKNKNISKKAYQLSMRRFAESV